MIRRLLIANRGEIAIRIARGARELGISPVGVFSDADETALFRAALDASQRIGPGPAAASYLDGAAVISAARALGADAIHPGYGFLSERAEFAQAVADAGLIFVGPPPAAIAAMGSKSEAKRIARAAGVATLDGYDGADQSAAALEREAAQIDVPLVIKAIAGGGGRGMRVVADLAHFGDALASARREALAAFGDGAVLLERYVANPRHIEVQILADAFGAIVHLGDRDCSIQRRHQKIVEEAPAPLLAEHVRARMSEAAVAVARRAGYVNAGTVEFLLDAGGRFAFLEMNARLQVEHPVTELVYGVDLVHEQLRIASGERLHLKQADLVPRGAAIEMRLNAEDPARDFAPQSGTIATFFVPEARGVRVDAGVGPGSDVPVFYDSLLAKVVAYGADRAAAVALLETALAGARVEGIATNLPLLRAIAHDAAFARAAMTTAFLTERTAALAAATAERRQAALLLAAGALLRDGYGWRAGGVGIVLRLEIDGLPFRVEATRHVDSWLLCGDIDATIALHDDAPAQREPGGITVVAAGLPAFVAFARPPSALPRGPRATFATGDVTAPMPGKIVSVAVKPGDTVMTHDVLVVLEAMKMEHRIDASLAGTVGAVHVAAGDLVTAGAPLVTIGAA